MSLVIRHPCLIVRMADAAPARRRFVARRGSCGVTFEVGGCPMRTHALRLECSGFVASDAAPQASVYAMATAIEH
ncbi:hypothetical protein EX530_08485 [Xanthomonas phaseoli]